MFQSYIISGGSKEERRAKALEIISFSLTSSGEEIFVKSGISTHPDLFPLLPQKSIGIEEIRDLKRKVALKPAVSSYKTFVIDEAQNLTTEAQNALLKTLEEPPSYTIILLLTPNSDLLLSTVVSRCQIISLLPKNEIKLSDKEEVEYYDILNRILASKVGERLQISSIITKSQEGISLWLIKIINLWHRLLKTKLELKEKSPLDKNGHALSLSPMQIVSAIRKTIKTNELIEKNINQKLALDHLFLSWPKVHKMTECVSDSEILPTSK